jgi:hypothetical protein
VRAGFGEAGSGVKVRFLRRMQIFSRSVTEKGFFSFAGRKGGEQERPVAAKVKKPFGELNCRARAVL